jgi:hypothetical protein
LREQPTTRPALHSHGWSKQTPIRLVDSHLMPCIIISFCVGYLHTYDSAGFFFTKISFVEWLIFKAELMLIYIFAEIFKEAVSRQDGQ